MRRIMLLAIAAAAILFTVQTTAQEKAKEPVKPQASTPVAVQKTAQEKAKEPVKPQASTPVAVQKTAQEKAKEPTTPKTSTYVLVDSKTLLPVLDCAIPTGWVSGGNVIWSEEFGAYPVLWYFWTMAPDMSVRVAYTSSLKTVLQGSLKKRSLLEKPKDFAKKLCDSLKKDFCLDKISVDTASVRDFESDAHKNFIERHKEELDLHHFGERIEIARYVEFSATFEGKLNGKDYVIHYKAPVFFAQRGLEVMATTIVEVFGMVAYGSVPEKEEEAKTLCETTAEKIRLNPDAIKEFRSIGSEMPTKWEHVQDNIRERVLSANQQKRSGMGVGEGVWEDYVINAERVRHSETSKKYLLNRDCVHAAINENGEIIYFDDSFRAEKPYPKTEWHRLK